MSLEAIARELAYQNDLAALEIEADFSGISENDILERMARLRKKYGRC
jgi:hypothetical protein